MNHKGTQTIETERLILRQTRLEDAEAMYKNWASNPRVTEFLTWQPHADVNVTKEIISMWVDQYKNDNFYQWAIELKEIGEPIGSISVVKQDEATGMVHVGYCIGQNWWHMGIMSEALAAVIKFFFTEVGVNRIETEHDPNNPHSGMVMKKCGMKYEGTLRQSVVSNKGVVDACYYGLLKNEWEEKNHSYVMPN